MVSGGISISTGRGRPLRSWITASRTAAGTSATWSTRRRHLVTGRMHSCWSFTSCRSPTSLPMLSRGTWPEIISTGDDAEYAVLRPDIAFSRPGPGTTSAVPNEPPARA